jgi:hypothetical protein
MKKVKKCHFLSLLLLTILVVLMALTGISLAQQPPRVNLGSAQSFAVLAGSGITVAGAVNTTTIYGDIGSSPTGSYTGAGNVVQTGGDVYLAGTEGEGVAEQAKEDLLIAYNNAAGRVSTMDITGQDLGNLSSLENPLLPGVYTANTSLGLTGTLYLSADSPNDAFIFQIGSTLTTASASNIVLLGEATECQVYWQVGSSATLGTNSTFVGHILALTDITATTGADIDGALLALNGAVTLDTNTIIAGDCPPPGVTDDDDPTTGSLTVNKVVSGDTAGITLPLFRITVTGPEGFTATRTFVHGESFTWHNLVPGTYTVTESRTGLSEEWTVSGEGSVSVTANQTASTTITNTFLAEDVPVGSLTVTKVVSGSTGGMTLPLYKITVTGPEGFTATRTFVSGESFTWYNLVPGTYTITEDRAGLSSEWTASGEGSVSVTANQTASTTITNTFLAEAVPVGSLKVTTVVSGDTGGVTLPLFKINITGPGGFTATRTFAGSESFTWHNLVPGTYMVTEDRTGLGGQWAVSGEGSVNVIANQTASATIINEYRKETPRTGGPVLLSAYSGLILLGIGLLTQRKRK